MRKGLPHESKSFPGIAFATLPETGDVIAIRQHERIYYRVETAKTADELNAIYGVSPSQAKAALAYALAGWSASAPARRAGPRRSG